MYVLFLGWLCKGQRRRADSVEDLTKMCLVQNRQKKQPIDTNNNLLYLLTLGRESKPVSDDNEARLNSKQSIYADLGPARSLLECEERHDVSPSLQELS